jgi:hypothetical protein
MLFQVFIHLFCFFDCPVPLYENCVLQVLDRYDPCENPVTRALMEGSAKKLFDYAGGLGIMIDTNDCYSACGVCRKTMMAFERT